MNAQLKKDIDELLVYIFQHEADDFVEWLCEQYPDKAEFFTGGHYIGGGAANWDVIDQFVLDNPEGRCQDHVYALAIRIDKAMKEEQCDACQCQSKK